MGAFSVLLGPTGDEGVSGNVAATCPEAHAFFFEMNWTHWLSSDHIDGVRWKCKSPVVMHLLNSLGGAVSLYCGHY